MSDPVEILVKGLEYLAENYPLASATATAAGATVTGILMSDLLVSDETLKREMIERGELQDDNGNGVDPNSMVIDY